MKDEHRFFDCIAGVVLAGIMVLGFGLLPQTAQAAEVKELARDAGQPERQIEVQAEYLDGRFFKDRNVDLYNVHVYQPYKKVHAMTMSYGMTLERAMGSIYWQDRTRDAGAFGLGPSYMLRFTRSLSPRWDISLDGTGSLLFYDHSHPDGGRGYGFLWRIGPRFTYHAGARDAVSLGYIFHHSSNGMKTRNPGYNGIGFSLGYTHAY